MEDPDDDRMYMVVVNHGAVFDLACRKSASCGLEVGRKDRHEAGVPSVQEVWTDMRPLSLRQKTKAGKA